MITPFPLRSMEVRRRRRLASSLCSPSRSSSSALSHCSLPAPAEWPPSCSSSASVSPLAYAALLPSPMVPGGGASCSSYHGSCYSRRSSSSCPHPYPRVAARCRTLGGTRRRSELSYFLLVLEIVGFADVALYALTSDVAGILFMCSQVCAVTLWVWRAWPARGGERWPEYRLVLLGLGGAFGGFALLAVLETVRLSLGLEGLILRGRQVVLVRAGGTLTQDAVSLAVRHDADELAVLMVGEKLRHDTLFAADREALAIFCQQLGAFLSRQQLLLRLCETVARLEDSQARLLTAHRLERERLGQALHRGPLQDILLLRDMLPQGNAADAALRVDITLRAILTETASTVLHDLGLPAAVRAYATHLAPYASLQGCRVAVDADAAVYALADDESFALYALAHEALANAVHHSGATRVEVDLRVETEGVLLRVRDDGCGLPHGWERARIDHRGLGDALDLVRSVRGGTAGAESHTDEGTTIYARVPLHRARQGEESQMMGGGTIRVLIAEDHKIVRQGLRRILSEDPDLEVVAEASNGDEILSLVLRHQPDVLLLDLDLPGQGGLDALRLVRDHAPRQPRALVLSAFCNEEYVRRARELGVDGFLSKDCGDDNLRRAVRAVATGKGTFDPAVVAISREQTYSGSGRFRRYSDGSIALTAAELAVLHKMLGGQSYEDISQDLGRSFSTVRTQAVKIMEKLDVRSRSEAVLKALQLGILRLEDAEIVGEGEHGS